MTSGNLSDEPMAAADAEALERLSGIADLFLAHDRAIENRCDDSVARVIAGSPTILRRARGYVPRPVALARPLRRPVLACGAQLKNTFCLAAGREAWLGPHIGDLDNLEATRAFEEQVERLQRFLGIRPEVIAHDLHPDYASTRYALKRPEPLRVAVQHHHAHVASAMAEHGLEGPVLGLAWDGTGYGTDGTAWGGELLRVTPGSCERLATLRPLRLAGGDAGDPPGLAHRARRARRRLRRTTRRSSGCASSTRCPPRDVGGRAPHAAGGSALAARARRRALLRRARGARPRPAAGELRGPGGARVEPASPRTRRRRRTRSSSPTADGLVEADLRPLVRAAVADIVGGARAGARLGGVPRDAGRRRGRAGPGSGRALRPAARGALRRLLPERAARRGRAPAPGGRLRGAAARARCRRGTAGSRSARRSWRTRSPGRDEGGLKHVPGGSGEGGRDLGRGRAAHGPRGLLRRDAAGLPRLRARGADRGLRARPRRLRDLAHRRAGGAGDARARSPRSASLGGAR